MTEKCGGGSTKPVKQSTGDRAFKESRAPTLEKKREVPTVREMSNEGEGRVREPNSPKKKKKIIKKGYSNGARVLISTVRESGFTKECARRGVQVPRGENHSQARHHGRLPEKREPTTQSKKKKKKRVRKSSNESPRPGWKFRPRSILRLHRDHHQLSSVLLKKVCVRGGNRGLFRSVAAEEKKTRHGRAGGGSERRVTSRQERRIAGNAAPGRNGPSHKGKKNGVYAPPKEVITCKRAV